MNKEELILKCNKIAIDADQEVRRLKDEFSINECKYGIGDIIEDHYHIIKVESIEAWRFPCVVYSGTLLTKKLVPAKRQSDTTSYSSNVVRKLN